MIYEQIFINKFYKQIFEFLSSPHIHISKNKIFTAPGRNPTRLGRWVWGLGEVHASTQVEISASPLPHLWRVRGWRDRGGTCLYSINRAIKARAALDSFLPQCCIGVDQFPKKKNKNINNQCEVDKTKKTDETDIQFSWFRFWFVCPFYFYWFSVDSFKHRKCFGILHQIYELELHE